MTSRRKHQSAALCTCTTSTHDEVRAFIAERGPVTVDAITHELDFHPAGGCERCRPALNYYLLSAFPERYVDDPSSRVVNERVHANVQRDGSYSVVPRVFGGVITAAQLRLVADVAERFQVPLVKLTGAQRIDLLGVPERDLPAMFAALREGGFVSGHAYARGVRAVKTCVGRDYCRYGVADSIDLGVALEEMTWASWTPHKVKLGVSACVRNCAEATIKDLGLVATEEGWDVYVGGSAGLAVRAAQRVVRRQSDRMALEVVVALLQLYREEGYYGERTWRFVSRVGLDYVQARVVLDAGDRAALFQRFHHAQRLGQEDPWARKSGSLIPASNLTRRASRPS